MSKSDKAMTTPRSSADSKDELPPIDRIARVLDQVRFYAYTLLLLLLFGAGLVWQRIFITVPAGFSAVQFSRFYGGTITGRVYDEGLHIIWPWNLLIPYETRLQMQTMKVMVLSEEGLSIGVTVALRYAPVLENLPYLHRDIGPDYYTRLIKPDVEGHLRHTFGGRPAHQIYSSARDVLQEISRVPLLGRVVVAAGPGRPPHPEAYLRLEELKLVNVELPEAMVTAINEKQRQEQLSLEYKYRQEREEKEAERKRTEAAGIRDYSLIAGKLSSDVLRWRSVDATADIAKSPNSKIVILGNSQNGLPLMLNFTDSPPAPATSAAAETAAALASKNPTPARPAPEPARPAPPPRLPAQRQATPAEAPTQPRPQ